MNERRVTQVITSHTTLEGGGFLVHRPFPSRTVGDVDPFLMLDEMGPAQYRPGEAKGAPDHPHRGFETVTYLLDGEMQHRDSAGHQGKLGPGDVQWMTAGSGVVHSEMPSETLMKKGGRLHGLQLWVNLPKTDKMTKPRYQEIPASQVPEARSSDGSVKVRVIAGESLGVRAVIETKTPIFYLHFNLEPRAQASQSIPAGYGVFAYVLEGEVSFGKSRSVQPHQMAVFTQEGQWVSFSAGEERSSLLLIGGVPLNEPIARYGPFVMNTDAEIQRAFEDYEAGRMGQITP